MESHFRTASLVTHVGCQGATNATFLPPTPQPLRNGGDLAKLVQLFLMATISWAGCPHPLEVGCGCLACHSLSLTPQSMLELFQFSLSHHLACIVLRAGISKQIISEDILHITEHKPLIRIHIGNIHRHTHTLGICKASEFETLILFLFIGLL